MAGVVLAIGPVVKCSLISDKSRDRRNLQSDSMNQAFHHASLLTILHVLDMGKSLHARLIEDAKDAAVGRRDGRESSHGGMIRCMK